MIGAVSAAYLAGCSTEPVRGGDPHDARVPREYAIIFNKGYGDDLLPRDPQAFEAVAAACKSAGFNAILTRYTDERAAILEKHGLKIMVDLLVPDCHVYKQPEAARVLAERLRGSPVVYAYHLWSDRIGGTVAGRSRDIANLRVWDPSHPAYVGDYNARALGDVADPDLIGYYDFHWERGGLYRHLQRALNAAKKHHALFLKYLQANPGRPGIGNFNRVLYTISQSTVFGMRGYMYHDPGGGQLMKVDTADWGDVGKDCARANLEIAPLGPELMKIGNPVGVYSTPVTRTARNDPADPPAVPEGLDAVPEDFWVNVAGGEALVGDYTYGEEPRVPGPCCSRTTTPTNHRRA